jgi:DegV family protein with EDD domain
MITIVTDSSVYIKREEAESLGIRVIPLTYTVKDWRYNESFIDENGDFESLLKNSGKFTTSQPNAASFLSCFEEELDKGNEVFCIVLSSRLSGAYSTAHMAARQTSASGRVVIFDSLLTAGGLYLLVKAAVELIKSGVTLSELSKKLLPIRDKISITFSVEDMTPLRNSGRLGFVRLSVGTTLNIRPILVCKDGAIVYDSTVRGNVGLIKKLAASVPESAKEIVINYIGENRSATNLYQILEAEHPGITIKLRKIGPVLGIHLGCSVMGVSVLTG